MSNSGAFYNPQPFTNSGTIYVTDTGNDSNNGLSVSTAKLTVAAAYAALPATGGIVQLGSGTYPLPSTAIGLYIDQKPVSLRGVGRVLTTITYAGTGTAIKVGRGEVNGPFIDWGNIEDLTIYCSANAAHRALVLDGAHRGVLNRVELSAVNNPTGSINLEGFDAYQNSAYDCLFHGAKQATVLNKASNDFMFLNTSFDGTGVVVNIIDSNNVAIKGGQISGLTSPCGVQVDAVTGNTGGFLLEDAYFDSGAGGVAVGFKIGPAATSTLSVYGARIDTPANMGGTIDKADMTYVSVHNVTSGHALTITANANDTFARFHTYGGTYSDSGVRTTKYGANTSDLKLRQVTANSTNFGYKHSPTGGGGQSLWFETAGDANPTFTCTALGFMAWGAGGAAGTDTTLERVASNSARTLRTNRAFKAQTVATGSRPVAADAGIGAMIYDSTLSKPVWSDGTVWRDAAGTAV